MRLQQLDLSGYRCFETASVAFDPGVTVIHGPNGSGKTTLLESVLFGLYGARALDDATLADVLTKGHDEGTVRLGFVHAGDEYTIEREVVRRDDRATTRTCVLEGPADERTEGARAVRRRIAELLRMDADAFVNSAYVKQGEINKLLQASPAERQSMIDELLQLGRLETYRDRADEARLAVRSLRRERDERIGELETQHDRLTEEDPYQLLNELESTRAELRNREGALEERLESLRDRRVELVDRLERHEERRERLDGLRERYEEVRAAIEETDLDRRQLREELEDRREELEAAEADVADLLDDLDLADEGARADARADLEDTTAAVEDELETLRDAIETLSSKRAEAEERRSALDDQLVDRRAELDEVRTAIERDEEVIEDRTDDIEALSGEIDSLRSGLEVDIPAEAPAVAERLAEARDRRDSLQEELQKHRERAAGLHEHVHQGEQLAEQDRCPTCGQPVADSPHLDRLEEERELLESHREAIDDLEDDREIVDRRIETLQAIAERLERRSSLDELLEERRGTLEEKRNRRAAIERTIEDLEGSLSEVEETVVDLEGRLADHRSDVAECNERLQTARARERALDELDAAIDDRDDIRAEIDRLRDRREHLGELQEERRDQLDDIEDRLRTLEDEVSGVDLEALEDERTAVEGDLETLEAERERLAADRDRLNERIGSVQSEIEQLETIEDRLAEVRERRDDLAGLQEETASLGDLYESVRADLRERNVATLERLLNEIFADLYRNDAYDRLHLEYDYTLYVTQKDGTPLDPMDLSGGERAVLNLSLRCAIYRLLAQGIEGAAPMPPLMLDEPTVFLDEGHVGRLVRLLETMGDLGVEQTLVVSHHETLLDAGDHRIAVEKDPTTNRSRASRVPRTIT